MTMPEAAVYKNDRSVFGENQVRLARQFPVMKPEPKAHRVKPAPYDYLGLGILGLDPGHHSAADFAAYDVSQALPPIRDLAV